MAQPLDGCPGCGGDQSFEQIHAVAGECPDVPGGECPEWACTSCGTAVIMGVPAASPARARTGSVQARQSVHAA